MHNIPWGMGKELGFHRRNLSKKGEKNCGIKLRAGKYIGCTDLYRSYKARDEMSVVWVGVVLVVVAAVVGGGVWLWGLIKPSTNR